MLIYVAPYKHVSPMVTLYPAECGRKVRDLAESREALYGDEFNSYVYWQSNPYAITILIAEFNPHVRKWTIHGDGDDSHDYGALLEIKPEML